MLHADVLQVFPEGGSPVFLQQQAVEIAVVMEVLLQPGGADGGGMKADVPLQLLEEGAFVALLVGAVEPGGVPAAEQGEEPHHAAADDVLTARAGEIVFLYQGL